MNASDVAVDILASPTAQADGQASRWLARMRLLLVIDSLGSGGAQRQLVNLGVELARRGHSVELFTYHALDFFAPRLQAAGIRWRLDRKPSRYSLRPVLALRKLLREGSFDAVVSFLAVPSLYAIAACAGVRPRPALVVSQRTSPYGDGYRWHDRLALRMFRYADHVTVNSHHMRAFLAAKYPRLAAKMTTIWNGIDLEQFLAVPRPQPASEPRLLAIGNLSPGKSWLTLADALRVLRDRHSVRANVTWVGALERLPRQYERELQRIKRFLSDHQLASKWSWLGPQTDLTRLFANFDALVHPSTQEGLPNVVCEALACGCPAIVSSALDHPRLVQDGANGFLFAPGDANDLASALFKLHQLEVRQRANMACAARRFAEEHLALATCVDRYEALLHQAVQARRGHA